MNLYQIVQNWLRQDIAERQRIEAALRDSERRFRTLFEETRQAILLIEADRFVAANRAALDMLRLERLDQLIGRAPDELSPDYQPDGRRSAEKAAELLRIAYQEGAHEFEWEHLRADGEPFIARVLLTVIHQSGHDLLHVAWSDISAQKKAERELEEYRQDLERRVAERTAELATITESLRVASAEQQAIFDTATSGIALVKDRILVRCNRKLHELFGWPPGAMAGQPTTIWYADEAAYAAGGDPVYEHIWRGESHCREQELLRCDGSRFWARLTGRAIDAADPRQGSVWVIDDITAERAVMTEMARARDLAEAAAKTKDEFLATISHELRTPLTAILGLTEALQDQIYGPQNERSLQSLKVIEDSGRHLLALINGLLDLAKIEAGQEELAPEPCRLSELSQASLQLVEGMASKKRQQISLAIAPHDLVIEADSRRLKQMLVNLLSNAVKFTPEAGQIGLEIISDPEAKVVRLTVWDTGIGIAKEDLPKLFQTFVQLDSRLDRQYAGTGLGLVLVKRMAELHGGQVTVESTPGQGSRFTIILPWIPPRVATAIEEARLADPESLAPNTSELILLAEDDEQLRRVFSQYLEAKDYRIAEAADGLEAMTKAQTLKPAIALIDIQMPGLNGFDVIQRLRADPDPVVARLPIIALTALAMAGDRERCLAAGANAYLSKPISLRDLLAKIQDLLPGPTHAQSRMTS